MKIDENQFKSMTIHEKPIEINGNQCKSMKINENQQTSMKHTHKFIEIEQVYENHWKSMTYHWKSMNN